jgi:heme a synthase
MPTESRLLAMKRLALASVVLTLAVMALGSWVKANGAGLSCPDWPQCYGEWLPPFPSADNGGTWQGEPVGYTQAEILYEWSHRFVVSLLLVPLAWSAVLAVRTKDAHATMRTLPVAALLLYVSQAFLGAITVVTGNPPWATTMHLVMATALLTLLVVHVTWVHLKPLGEPVPDAEPDAPAKPRQVSFVYPEAPTATEPEA